MRSGTGVASRAAALDYITFTHTLICYTRAMNLHDYETVRRQCLYDPDIWLRTMEAVARWLKFCADNAHTRTTIKQARRKTKNG